MKVHDCTFLKRGLPGYGGKYKMKRDFDEESLEEEEQKDKNMWERLVRNHDPE